MDFRQKIDKVLSINKVKLWKLAEESGLGTTLEKAYKENREMRSVKTDQFLQNIGIPRAWWENPTTPLLLKAKSLEESDGKIPFYDSAVMGGLAILADQTPVEQPTEMIEPGTWFKQASGALRVYGHSMFPKYPSGCIVAFKVSTGDVPSVIVWGEDYVIELEDRRILKRVEKGEDRESIRAVSYNVNKDQKYVYDPIDIPRKEIKRMYIVLGKVELEASI